MKQTAVEQFEAHLIEYGFDLSLHKFEIQTFKEMEKEQNYNLDNLRDAYRWGTTVSSGTSDHFEEFLHNIKIK